MFMHRCTHLCEGVVSREAVGDGDGVDVGLGVAASKQREVCACVQCA